MADIKHTPGPWQQAHREAPTGGRSTQVFTADDPSNTIATLAWHVVKIPGGYRTDRDANARLIAASPDMLEALERCLNFIANTESEMGETLECGDKARAAIAKAKGGV